ncbi:hypothetical protein Tco_0482489 [Tanacetum coccineum]
MEQPQSSIAQQITPADQLVHSSKFQTVRNCNNKAVLPNIPRSKKCRIVWQLLVDHAISYALTAIADVLAVYIKQFWKTVKQVSNHNETIHFMDDKEEITYNVDMPVHFSEFLAIKGHLSECVLHKEPCTTMADNVQVEEKLLEEDVEKIVEGVEDLDGNDFVDTLLLSDEDSGDRLEPGSHKDKPKEINDDDDDKKKDDKKEDADTHSLTPRSPRTDLSSEKAIDQELMVFVSPKPATLSQDQTKPTSSTRTNLLGKLTVSTTNDLIRDALPRMVNDVVTQDRESSQVVNTILNVHHIKSDSTATTTSDLQQQLYLKMKSDLQAQRDHDENQGNDAPLKGEKSAKMQNTSKNLKSVYDPVIDEDKVIPVDETPELIEEFQNVDKRVPTIFYHERMEAVLRDMLSNQDLRRPNPNALVFYGPQRNPNEPPRYLYNKDLFFLKYGNTEEKRLDYMERIVVMRENDKPYRFSEADFKYLNKNDIEDIKLPDQDQSHCSTSIFPGIEECNPFSIVYKPTTGLIYLNNKNEKRFMDLEELSKFCDATLEKVLKAVNMKIFETEFMKKTPPLGSLYLKIMKAYEKRDYEASKTS